MIIVDYSQCAVAAVFAFQRELKSGEEPKNIIRHAILSTLKSYKKRYGSEYGEIVIACDARNYWRKDVFPFYKCTRKEARDKSDLDWGMIFDIIAEIKADLIEHFPYKVISVDKAEGDDIVAVLTKWLQENQLTREGIIEEPQPILIISSDKDFKQLQEFRNVRQWSPILKKFVSASFKEINEFRIEHIVKGDIGDAIPSILCPDDFYANRDIHGRAPPVSKKRLESFIENGIAECKTDQEVRNWHRNFQLVSFDAIPENISNAIIDAYINSKPNGDKMSVMNYLIKNKCRLLLNEIEEF